MTPPRRRRHLVPTLLAVTLAILVTGCTPDAPPRTPSSNYTPAAEASTSSTPNHPTGDLANGTYDVVITDPDIGPAGLTQYWVAVEGLDVATGAYRDTVKQIVSDLARAAGTTDIIVNVVTDPKIAEAESPATVLGFIAEYGDEYLVNTIPELEVEGWVASYSGGLNPEMVDPTVDLAGYEIVWWPYDTLEVEAWKPELSTTS